MRGVHDPTGRAGAADPKLVRAYGDREGDGMVQMSFVLGLPPSERAREAARRFAELHGLSEPLVSTMEEAAEGYSDRKSTRLNSSH